MTIRFVDDIDSYSGYVPVESLQELVRICKISGQKKYLLDLNIHDLDKKELKYLEKNSKQDITVLNKIKKEEINPFELANGIMTMTNRKELFEYLMDLKPNLFVSIKYLNCGIHLMDVKTQEVLKKINKYFYKVNPEMIYAMLAFDFKPRSKLWIKWLYIKAKKEDD